MNDVPGRMSRLDSGLSSLVLGVGLVTWLFSLRGPWA